MACRYLLAALAAPNGMSRNYTYEPHRDLIATLNDKRGTTAVVNRSYTYNALGIPTNRTIQRQGATRNDTFTHNDRNELTAATMGADSYAYDYDNIGKAPEGSEGDWTNLQGLPRRGEPPMGWRRVNRKTAQEVANEFTYEANALNQYTQITENDTDFTPEFDLDGNQTRIKTTTGIWTATYNALNRPLTFSRENADGTSTVITADYDYMGRRVFKKVETVTTDSDTPTETRTIITHHRYLYRSYLQIAALDLTRTTLNALWYITWDPTEPVATRPLAIQQSGTWYTYGLDLPKNVTELYGTNGYIVTAYTYSPYGLVTASGSVTQYIQWSSEYNDTDLGLVYYNYRHYNPLDGRWTGRDSLGEVGGYNLFSFLRNLVTHNSDVLGEDLFIKNTQEASGYHWKICVTTWKEANRKSSKNDKCCIKKKLYEKSGQYCIGFGPIVEIKVSISGQYQSISNEEKLAETKENLLQNTKTPAHRTPVPPQMQNVNGPDANGIIKENNPTDKNRDIYKETGRHPKHLPDVKTNCKEDKAILEYFEGQVGQTATYSLFGNKSNRYIQEWSWKYPLGCPNYNFCHIR